MIREQGSTVVTWLCGSFSNTAAACHGSWENNYFAQTALSELNLSSHVDLGHQKSAGALHWCSYYCSKPWAALLQVWAQGSSTKCSFWAGCTKHGIATLPAWQEKEKKDFKATLHWTRKGAGCKGLNSLLHFCLSPSLFFLHFLLPLFLSLLFLPETFQSLSLLLLKGDEFRLYQLLGPVSTLRLLVQ